MRFKLRSLREKVLGQPCWQTLVTVATVDAAGNVEIPDELCLRYPILREVERAAIATHVSKAKPRETWPAWAIDLAKHAQPGDAGLGDVVARVIGPFGSDAFKLWYAEKIGVFSKTCGCAGWHQPWNIQFPFVDSPPSVNGAV